VTAKFLVGYLAAAAVFLALDFVWLSQVASGFYRRRLGDLLLDTPNIGAAAGFYAVYVVGIVIFALAPALRADSAARALILGSLFGFFCYATYDLTNYAVLKGWSVTVAMVDIAWGTCLTGVAALAGYLAVRITLQ
jgi:uncharacterized membrane protein